MNRVRTRTKEQIQEQYEVLGKDTGYTWGASPPTDSQLAVQWDGGVRDKHLVTEHCEDVVTNDYFTRRNNGEIINNALYKQDDWFQTIHLPQYELLYSNLVAPGEAQAGQVVRYNRVMKPASVSSGGIWSKDFFAHLGDFSSQVSAMSDSTLTKAYEKAKESPTLAYVSGAELDKTITLLTTLGRRLWTVFFNPRFRKILFNEVKSIKRASKTVANEWLQYRYGIRQLMFDIENSIRSVELAKRPPRARFTSTERQMFDTSGSFTTASGNEYVNYRYDCQAYYTYEVTSGVLYQPELDTTVRNLHAFGFDKTASTVWELIRFSFILDWFIDVGSWITAWEPIARGKFLCAWTTVSSNVRHQVDTSMEIENYPEGTSSGYQGAISRNTVRGPLTVTGEPLRSTGIRKELTRTPKSNPPFLPTINVRLNGQKLADILSLLRGVYR